LRDAGRAGTGHDVVVGDHLPPGGETAVLLPPADPALLGPTNRALGARGVTWRFGAPGTPGPLASTTVPGLAGAPVARRYRLLGSGGGPDAATAVLATVNGEPWLVRAGAGRVILVGSRLDTAWTGLVTAPAFVPFVDALVNRIARGTGAVVDAEGAPRIAFDVRGTDTLGATVYGVDPQESDLTPAAAADLRRAFGGSASAEILDDAAFDAGRFAGLRVADLGGVLLVCALLLAAVELGVASLTR